MYNEIFNFYRTILPKEGEWASNHKNLLKLLSIPDMAYFLMEYIQVDCSKFICSILEYAEHHKGIEEAASALDVVGEVVQELENAK